MRPDTETPRPVDHEPPVPIDYRHFRALAVIERRKAIVGFPGAVRRWIKPIFRRLFSTLRPFRANPDPWLSTSKSAASRPTKR